ncbi:hypothetical protein HOE425_330573 [Hoeflea sp. EC-HK425]|nr:hypothetical protein HOE425_330573 [Hoeflea sp. EC-HK425]
MRLIGFHKHKSSILNPDMPRARRLHSQSERQVRKLPRRCDIRLWSRSRLNGRPACCAPATVLL